MNYRLTIRKPWRYRDRRRGLMTLQPGEYTVPEQVRLDVARLAVDQGMATILEVQMPQLPKQESAPVPNTEAPRRAKRGPKRRKGPAPENKLLHADDNKQTLV